MQFKRISTFTGLLIILCVLSSTVLIAQPDPIASWPFNNDALDASGNGYDATLKGNAGYSDDALNGSHSLLLDGNGDYAQVSPIDFGNQFTICAWVYLEPDVENIQTIIGNATGGSTIDGFKLFVNNWETNNKRIIIEVSDGVTRLDAVTPENTFEDGLWNHVAITMDRENGIAQIYYNGVDVTETGAIVPNFQITDNVTIGSMVGPDWFWTGMIDDMRIYQGLLTVDEIDEVMGSPETGIQRRTTQRVKDFNLHNYPNPFNPHTIINFNLEKPEHVRIEIYNTQGERVRVLVDEQKSAGRHQVLWNGLDDFNQVVPSGSYLCRIASDRQTQTHKMLLIR